MFRAIKIRPVLSTLAATIVALGMSVSASPSLASDDVARVEQQPKTLSTNLPDGTYLYGESPEAGQIGAFYLVFTVEDNNVIGAFYQPRSSFDCFVGTPQEGQLALTVTDSYTQEQYTHAIAIENAALIASTETVNANNFSLEGLHRLDELSEMDNQILETCQNDLADEHEQ
ncbi:hypothetical protein PN462_22685 [Spirulina sp. CS-785/01]|uniref:hypothetical protein n=1 Tax=Spirulina sp. CS-785/01 TaxID=3021716 RepID=UPI0023311144|nr:hypothetical protein [Spirulina sp. CS-785/01]MDB9315937.1 hypothetical protein [Spirulina sp. CS-785/01]